MEIHKAPAFSDRLPVVPVGLLALASHPLIPGYFSPVSKRSDQLSSWLDYDHASGILNAALLASVSLATFMGPCTAIMQLPVGDRHDSTATRKSI